MFEINFFALITTTLLAMAVGLVWYSPWVCGRIWMEAVGISETDLEKNVWFRFGAGFFTQIVLLYVVVYLVSILRATIPMEEALASSLVALVALQGGSCIWERKSLAYFLVNAVYTGMVVVGGSLVIIYWPW